MNIKDIIDVIDVQRWDYGCNGHKQHNSSLDRIEAVATMNERMLGGFREAHNKMDERIRELEDELNAYKLKELALQGEPSTWYDDSLKRRDKAREAKLELRARLILVLRGRIADLERKNAKLLRELDDKGEK